MAGNDYYSLDALLSETQKVPCSFNLDVPNMGHLEGTSERDVRLPPASSYSNFSQSMLMCLAVSAPRQRSARLALLARRADRDHALARLPDAQHSPGLCLKGPTRSGGLGQERQLEDSGCWRRRVVRGWESARQCVRFAGFICRKERS